jgi:hypothetical protein
MSLTLVIFNQFWRIGNCRVSLLSAFSPQKHCQWKQGLKAHTHTSFISLSEAILMGKLPSFQIGIASRGNYYLLFSRPCKHGTTTLSIMKLSIKTFSIMKLSIMTLSIKTLNIMKLSLTTFSIKTLSIGGLYVTISISDSQHKWHSALQCSAILLCVIMLSFAFYLLMLNVIMLSFAFYLLLCHAECQYAECCFAECRCAECHYAWCCYAECHYAEWSYTECCYAECRSSVYHLIDTATIIYFWVDISSKLKCFETIGTEINSAFQRRD